MSELSKTQLKSENNNDFPNNNAGAITPAILRSFNADMIDSTVNQTIYTADSSSWTSDIDVLQAFSASQYILNQTLATTGSNTFNGNQIVSGSITSTGTIFTNGIDTVSGNTLTISSDLNVSGTFISDLQAGYVWLGSTSGRAVAVPSSSIAAGGSTDLTALNAFTASQETKNSTLASYTGSNDTKWSTLSNVTASILSTTASLNSYTQSQDTKNSTLATYTASVDTKFTAVGVSTASLNSYTASQDTKNSTLASVTASLFTSASLAITTASFSANTLTFTKGDNSFFNVFNAFATTGSNTFTGAQTLNADNNVVSGSITFNGTSQFNNTASIFNSIKLNNSIFNVSNFLQIDVASGSIVLQTPSNAQGISGLSHLSASSANSQVNLVFKNNNNNGDTIISGSNNIFTNPGTPTTGYKRYIGGANNLYLNNTNGITSQITQSATTVSGATPTMNNNIFNGTNAFTINQAPNPGTHTYSHNIFSNGTITINALAFTGSLNLPQNYSNGTITINAASASVAEIATGISGSGTVTVGGNGSFGGTMTITSPRTLLTSNTQNVNNNILAGGGITITNISSSAQVNASNNIGGGSFTYLNAGAAGLGLHTTAGSMNSNYGAMTLIASASAINASNNISPAAMTVTNRVFSGSLGLGAMQFNNNQTQGASNTYTATGSFGGTSAGPIMQANGIFGASNTIFTNVEGRGNYVDVRNNLIGGTFLILTGSNNLFTTSSGGGYFGRFNANDGLRNGTAENILVVGTGTSADNRKTGFLIDSGSNTFVEGSFNVSGSTSMTGSLTINGSTIVSGSVRGNVLTQAITSTTASFDFSTANFFELTLVNSTNTRVEATNVKPGQTINVLVTQAGSPGNGTISFSSAFDFPAVSPYTASVIADAKDILTFVTFANTGSIYAAAVKNLI